MRTVLKSITILGMPNRTMVNLTRLKELMEEKRWKASELATYSGVKYDTVYSLLTGRRPNSNVATVKQIADALDVSVDYLLGLSDERMPSGEVMPSELRRLLAIAGDLPAMRQEELSRIASALVELERERMASTIPTEGTHTLIEELVALSQEVGKHFLAAKLTCATAESCTGGLVGHLLTEIAGSSAYFMGGAIVYSNEIKARVLGVSEQTLDTDGAVSYATAKQMAAGALRLYDVDVAVAITGIAGPGGGSPTKPVGLVYVHVATRGGYERGERFVWPADRSGNKLLSAQAALQMMLDYLTTRVGEQAA